MTQEIITKRVTELQPQDFFKIGKQRNWRIVGKVIIPKKEEWEPKSYEHIKGNILIVLTNCRQMTVPDTTNCEVLQFKPSPKFGNECSEDDLPF